MKRLYKSSVLLAFLLLIAFPVFPQMWIDKDVVPLAPDVWSFMKYGGQSAPDLYTGTLHLSIPLYTYKDQDFEIPISMDYTSNGFMPNKTTGVVGLGWNLNVGGCITRTVRQYPDDDSTGYASGCLHYSPEDVMQNPLTHKERLEVAQDGRTACYRAQDDEGHTLDVETEPDIYTFRFNGHTGKFLLTKPGGEYKAWLYDIPGPGGEYKIQVRDIEGRIGKFNFTIVTGDGYKYHFDHKQDWDYYSKTETFIQSSLENQETYGFPYITWLLTAIEAPNGRKVEFSYDVCGFATCVQPTVSVYSEAQEYTNSATVLTHIVNSYITGAIASYVNYSTRYTALKEMSVDGDRFLLTAHYSPREHPEKFQEIGQNDGENSIELMQKLDSLLIRSDAKKNLLKKITFGYKSMPATSNPILILKDIRISDEGVYTMAYNDEDSIFPYQGTTSLDHWGYLNDESGKYDFLQLIPALKIDNKTGLQTIIKEKSGREPNFNAAIKGTLSRITYPTGGYTCFEYEPHQCSHQLVRDLTNPTYVIGTANDEVVGGVRIREITDCPQPSVSRKKTYTYETAGRSSGILMRSPMYYQSFGYKQNGNSYTLISRSSETSYPYTLDASHICYSDVTETLSNGAVTKYHFSSYLDPECADLFVSETDEELEKVKNVAFDVHHLYTEADSRYVLRGKLLRKEHFESGKTEPWSVERYKYVNRNLDSISGQKVRYYSSIKNSITAFYVSKTYLDNCLLDEWSCTYFDGADSTMLHKKYTYNRLNQEISVRTTDYGLRTSTLSEKQFLADLDAKKLSKIQKKMLDCNIVCYPIKTLSAFHKSVNPNRSQYRLTDGTYYEFGMNQNFICLKSLRKAQIPTSRTASHTFCGFEFDDLLFTERSYLYNKLNHPIEIRNRANRPTTILWGYGGLYPVAVIKNWSIMDCWEVIKKNILTQPFAEGVDEQYRQHILEQPNIEATFYTYQPYVGITSICDPSERFTYYDYDQAGRLKLILDDRVARIKAYKYNIQNQ